MLKRFTMLTTTLIWLLGVVGVHSLCAQEAPPQPVGPPPGGAPAPAGGPPPPPPPPGLPGGINAPALQYVSPGVFEIGKCKIFKERGAVELPASVNMKEGLLEYLLVGSSGKLHESLLRTDVEPYALQVALLLSGLEGSLTHLNAQGENRLPEGDPIEITVSWSEDGKEKTARIEEMVLQGKEKAGQIPWVFTGSVVNNGSFAAQVTKSIIAVYHDPLAMIDHRLEDGASDEVWFANAQTTPPVGTPMTVTITNKAQKPKK